MRRLALQFGSESLGEGGFVTVQEKTLLFKDSFFSSSLWLVNRFKIFFLLGIGISRVVRNVIVKSRPYRKKSEHK